MTHTSDTTMAEVIENSFFDYHVKGFDYVCLRRSPQETVKLYFFDGDVSKMAEVVNPHDHRYDFDTICIAGEVENRTYAEAPGLGETPPGAVFQQFAYRTPLNGGNGFEWKRETRLIQTGTIRRAASGAYRMRFDEIHTIQLLQPETVLGLVQYEDRVTDAPTMTFTRDREPPSLDGLYRKPSADEVRARLKRLQERVPALKLPKVL